jgi:hypothetical protein
MTAGQREIQMGMLEHLTRDLVALSFLALAALFGGSPANATECTKDDSAASEAVISYLDSWENMHSAFKQFQQCDDGAVAEGFSEAVARLMADHWAMLPRLLSLVDADPAFEAFVIRHLDLSNSNTDLLKIDHFAHTACPARARTLCGKIHVHLQSLGRDKTGVLHMPEPLWGHA